MDIRKRLILVMLAIFVVIMAGSLGYYFLYHGEVIRPTVVNFLDSMLRSRKGT